MPYRSVFRLALFDGKPIIVTGGGSGIDACTPHELAAQGARVVLLGRKEDKLKAVADELREDTGREALVFTCDIRDEDKVRDTVAAIYKQVQQVDGLVNNAGIAGHDYSTITDSDTETWQAILGVNLMGPMFFIRAVGKHMQVQGGGAIVNTASVAGIRSGAGGNAYRASKAAVINLTKTAACDLGQYNVRVNAVCPGLIETGMTKPVFDYARDNNKEQKLGSRCELRRYGRPEEIAAAMAFLASDDASYITGQALAVDGGNTASLNLPGMKH